MRRYKRRLALLVAFAGIVAVLAASAAAYGRYRLGRAQPVPIGTPTAPPEGEGWVDLLADPNAEAWRYTTDDPNNYIIQDGMLHLYGNAIYPLRYVAYTGVPYGDFELHVEFRLAKDTNSGIFLRAHWDDPVRRGFEIQILDDHGKPPSDHGSGALYDIATPMFNMSRPLGEWNSFDITAVGGDLEVVMNGWLVLKTDFDLMTEPLGKFRTPYANLPEQGMIMIQDHGGEAWFRNVRVRPIPPPLNPSPPQPEISPRGE
jgi:hypothetical protein